MDIVDIILYGILIVIIASLTILFGGWFLANWIKPLRKFYCNIIWRHCWPSQRQYPAKEKGYDCTCAWCHRDGMIDSQGNFF